MSDFEQRTWSEFRSAGLLWLINRGLHVFGWAIVVEIDTDSVVTSVYPARTRCRGFTPDADAEGFKLVAQFMRDNAETLADDCQSRPIENREVSHRPICSFFDAISECERSNKIVAVGHGVAFTVVDGAIRAVNLEPPIRVLPASKTVIPTRVDMLSTGWSVVAFEDLPGLVEASRRLEMLAKLAAPPHLDGATFPNDPVTE